MNEIDIRHNDSQAAYGNYEIYECQPRANKTITQCIIPIRGLLWYTS